MLQFRIMVYMGAKTLLTFEQFEQLPDDGLQHQLLRGEHIVLPPPKKRHTCIQQAISDLVRPYVHEHRLGEVHIEAGFRLSRNTWLQPDVSFVRTSQIRHADPDGYYEGAPALAVEVASDANTAAQLFSKMEEYFAHGAQEVWTVHPTTKSIQLNRPNGTAMTATSEMQSDLFPGLSIPLNNLFQD